MIEAIARYRSIIADLAIGCTLKADDAAWLHGAFVLAVQTDVPIERAMSLPRKWRERIRIADAVACLLDVRAGAPHLAALLSRIANYRAGEFKTYRDKKTVPQDDRAPIHRFLIAYRGKVPSLRTLQGWLLSRNVPPL
jgi:hypothetical protein